MTTEMSVLCYTGPVLLGFYLILKTRHLLLYFDYVLHHLLRHVARNRLRILESVVCRYPPTL